MKKSIPSVNAGTLVLASAFMVSAFMAGSIANASELEPVRGVVKSNQEAVLSVDLNARVMETPVKVGQAFNKDDILVKFDCKIQKAEARAAEAAYAASKSAHKNNVELQQHGAVGELEVNVSKAEMNQALANSEAISARTRDCEILAPYDGRVAELVINTHETSAPNQPLLKIVSSGEFEIQLIVPSSWLSWMKVGSPFEFTVDETGEQLHASIWQIGAEVDAVSRTVPLVAKFTSFPSQVLPGMSGTAQFTEQ